MQQEKKEQSNSEMGKDVKKNITLDIQMANKHRKRCSK
jgi:hypothetical protein